MNARVHVLAHVDIMHTHMCSHMYTCMPTHAPTPTRMHAHIHAHLCTHAPLPPLWQLALRRPHFSPSRCTFQASGWSGQPNQPLATLSGGTGEGTHRGGTQNQGQGRPALALSPATAPQPTAPPRDAPWAVTSSPCLAPQTPQSGPGEAGAAPEEPRIVGACWAGISSLLPQKAREQHFSTAATPPLLLGGATRVHGRGGWQWHVPTKTGCRLPIRAACVLKDIYSPNGTWARAWLEAVQTKTQRASGSGQPHTPGHTPAPGPARGRDHLRTWGQRFEGTSQTPG